MKYVLGPSGFQAQAWEAWGLRSVCSRIVSYSANCRINPGSSVLHRLITSHWPISPQAANLTEHVVFNGYESSPTDQSFCRKVLPYLEDPSDTCTQTVTFSIACNVFVFPLCSSVRNRNSSIQIYLPIFSFWLHVLFYKLYIWCSNTTALCTLYPVGTQAASGFIFIISGGHQCSTLKNKNTNWNIRNTRLQFISYSGIW